MKRRGFVDGMTEPGSAGTVGADAAVQPHVEDRGCATGLDAMSQRPDSGATRGSLRTVLAGGHSQDFELSCDGSLLTKKTHRREQEFYIWLHGLAHTPPAQCASFHGDQKKQISPKAASNALTTRTGSAGRDTESNFQVPRAPGSPGSLRLSYHLCSQCSSPADHPGRSVDAAGREPCESAPPCLWQKTRCDQQTFKTNCVDTVLQARALRPWIPDVIFVGEASLESAVRGDGPVQSTGTETTNARDSIAKSGILVMANILHGMQRPVVLDLKMGTRTYGDDASPEKRARAVRYAGERGSASLAMAFSGLCAVRGDGAVVCFQGGSRAPKGYRHPRTEEDFVDVFRTFLSFAASASLRNAVAASLLSQLRELEVVLKNITIVNFYGSSILVAYDAGACEGDAHVKSDVENPPLPYVMREL
ncbi:hypothetical protein BESB_052170 [Besnoitia besnoiti]|uniref:Kinase n=1 Tax=Besnoitia besnoiti TaxID=94643 RepID=A0A2A9MHY6_BESBE|nr:hypothetical protein BESB_052170 [Besnoitia besnoiti]PFH35566.1 hypothetical protein BESB_052170 [Besnoitia besnoiti]